MAECLAAIGVAANIAQLLDVGGRVLKRLVEYHSNLAEIPKAFRNIKTELPLLLHTLEQTRKAIDEGQIGERAKAALDPVVVDCKEQVELLDRTLQQILPTADSWREKTKKAIQSLAKQSEVERVERNIKHHIQSLTYHHAAALSTLQPLTGICCLICIIDSAHQIRRYQASQNPQMAIRARSLLKL
jgi:hypothetical protein